MNIVDIFRLFLFVREAPIQNTGQRVEAIQRWCGGEKGQSWCVYLATMVLDIFFQGKSPLPREGSCDVVWTLAKRSGWIVTEPTAGDFYLFVRNGNDAHHIGMVTGNVTPTHFDGIAGNTSEDGHSSNGDRCAERPITRDPSQVFFRVPGVRAA